MKKIKIISMDFDGTLLTSDKKISDRTRRCLKEIKNKSYKIIGVTARNLLSAKGVIDDVSLFDYIILNNGSDIYYVEDEKMESVSCVEDETVKRIFDLCNSKSYQIDFCTPYKYLIKTNQRSDTRPFIKYIGGLSEVDGTVSRMNVFFKTNGELEENRSLIENSFKNVNVVKMLDTDKENSPIWLTINPKNANKLSTLKKICDDIHSSIDEAIFFGDGENDLILIENAGIGVAMENAIEIVKAKASYVTLSNDNDGVAEFLEKNLE